MRIRRIGLFPFFSAALAFAAVQCGAQTDGEGPPHVGTVTIKRSSGSNRHHASFDGKHVDITNMPLGWVMQMAYGLPSPAPVEGPEWITGTNYDVEASTDAGVTPATPTWAGEQPLLMDLLRDRFHLAAHVEQKTAAGFSLVVARGGPLLKPAATHAGRRPGMEDGPQTGILEGRAATMAMLAASLGVHGAGLVSDRTGLSGQYDFTLHWDAAGDISASRVNVTNQDRLNPEPGKTFGQQCERGQVPGCVLDSNVPGLRKALQEQLGLELQPIEYRVNEIVIDDIERPSLN